MLELLMSFGFIYIMDGFRIRLVPFGSPSSLLASMYSDRPLVRRYLHAKICWVEYCFEGVQRPSTNNCTIGVLHISNVENNMLCPCIENIAKGDRHSYLAKCHNLSSSKASEGVRCIMYLVIRLLHLPESLRKDDVCRTTCVH
jgi:hypothetical protein